jgi:hypothetical protein
MAEEKWKLGRLNQCAKCPWKVSTDPFEIPDGYGVDLHASLANTIAEPGAYRPNKAMHIFACHESPLEQPAHCIGWLMNQLGPGNNIGLRLSMRNCENIQHVKLDGPQHACFEDTLPDEY